MTTTGDAEKGFTDGSDFYLLQLEEDAQSLIYATYFGGDSDSIGGEHVDGGTSRFDKSGRIYQAVCASCGEGVDIFPTTQGAWAEEIGSNACNLGVFRMDFEPNLIFADAIANPGIEGCAPYEVFFEDNSNRGITWTWDLGDGTTSTDQNPTHTYTVLGDYQVTLIVTDPSACNLADTTELTISVPDFTQVVIADYDVDVPGMCEGRTVTLTNNSILQDPIGDYIWRWDYGDGTQEFGVQDHQYTYDEPGDYTLELIVNSGAPCFDADTITRDITILEHPLVEAVVEQSAPTCKERSVDFQAVSNAVDYFWILTDGSIVNGPLADEYFSDTGIYEVQLVAIDNSTCNMQDTTSYVFEVFDIPMPDFEFLTPIACLGEGLQIENNSIAPHDLSYEWAIDNQIIGNGELPNYITSEAGNIEVCLTTTDQVTLCDETFCNTIEVKPFDLQLPTAFSPNGDDVNDILKGIGIEVDEMELSIYNRWGELMFNSINDKTIGWDGRNQDGVEQDISVYAYLLTGTNSCGNEVTQYGNVTLIR